MKLKKMDPNAIDLNAAPAEKTATTTAKPMLPRVKTAVRAGDLYMQNPRGGN
jgi:hypothetical protein